MTQSEDFWEDQQRARQIMTRLKELREVVKPWNDLLAEVEEINELLKLVEDEESEKSQRELQEIQELLNKCQQRLEELELRAYLDDPDDPKNCYLEIHPGAGGTESCDWAQMLLRMYLRWAEQHKFTTQIVDSLPGEEAGIKSATVYITGAYAYGFLKAESGVHRLVRISPFDANK
ncbi:MAG: PCRF domain-containing protein, partial [Candidatus Sumerlaeia bacterium]|nr:PCRF domain-containing protein [Candidatus Sumerlaeia bacterium]